MEKKNLAKKMLLVGALATGIIGVNSIFNEAQACTVLKSPTVTMCFDKYFHHTGYGASCVPGYTACTPNTCLS